MGLVLILPINTYDYVYHAKNYSSYKMGEVKQINTKNQTHNSYKDMINIKNFEPNLLKINRKSYKNIGIYNIGYITIKKIGVCKNIYSLNPLYLLVNNPSWYIKEKNGNNFLIFDSTDENKEILEKYSDVWSGIKNKTEEISSGECDYKTHMTIKFKF